MRAGRIRCSSIPSLFLLTFLPFCLVMCENGRHKHRATPLRRSQANSSTDNLNDIPLQTSSRFLGSTRWPVQLLDFEAAILVFAELLTVILWPLVVSSHGRFTCATPRTCLSPKDMPRAFPKARPEESSWQVHAINQPDWGSHVPMRYAVADN